MANILTIYEQESVSQLLTNKKLKRFADRYGLGFKTVMTVKLDPADIEWADTIVAIRSMSPHDQYVLKRAREIGKKCVIFWDDNLFDPNCGLFIPSKRVKAMNEAVKDADAILGANRYLIDQVASLSEHAVPVVADTILDAKEFDEHAKDGNAKVRLVFAGGKTHEESFHAILKDAFVELKKRVGDSFSLTFVGAAPEINGREELDVTYVGSMPLENFRAFLAEGRFDLGLSPLPDNSFTNSKYYNKYTEYALAGIVGIYSNCAPYTCVVKHGQNGFLCANTTDEWVNQLEVLIRDRSLIRESERCVAENVRTQFSEEGVLFSLAKQFPSFLGKQGNGKKIGRFAFMLAKLRYWVFKTIYLPVVYVKHEGLKALVQRLKNYFSDVSTIKKSDA